MASLTLLNDINLTLFSVICGICLTGWVLTYIGEGFRAVEVVNDTFKGVLFSVGLRMVYWSH